MNKKKTNTLALVAATVALVVSTYVLAAANLCHDHDPSATESCRYALEQIYQPPDSNVIIGDEECSLASESGDDLVAYYTAITYSGSFWCIGSTTYCGVAYDCPTLGLQMVDYIVGPYGWYETYLKTGTCDTCPDVPGPGW